MAAAAAYTLLGRVAKPQCRAYYVTSLLTRINTQTPPPHFSQVRSLTSDANSVSVFDKMITGNQRKYYMLGGTGGVGKTSLAASLAVKFANHGHPTIVVSTDPAHSLSNSFDQDLSARRLGLIQGLKSPLLALEFNLEKMKEDIRSVSKNNGADVVRDMMYSGGLGMIAEQLGDLKLAKIFNTPPPGLEEAIMISKVIEKFVDSPVYSRFTRIVFDTAPTGDGLRLLSLPDLMDTYIGKMMKMAQKIDSAISAIKSVFGKQQQPPAEDIAEKLEQLRVEMAKYRDLFCDSETTEFVIVTTPTVMAIKESSMLHASLKKENVRVQSLVVNQLLQVSDCKFCLMRRKDQMRALDMVRNDPELASLALLEAPLVDVEIRGIPALRLMGDMVWK